MTIEKLDLAFAAYISIFYTLDTEYPKDYSLFLSIFHRIIFGDNRVVDCHFENYNVLWKELVKFLPWIEDNSI